MKQHETPEANGAQKVSSGKKPWIAPRSLSEDVKTVTRGNQGGAGDSFNSCHS